MIKVPCGATLGRGAAVVPDAGEVVVIVAARTVAADNISSRFIRGLIRDVRPKPTGVIGPLTRHCGRGRHRQVRVSTGRGNVAAR
ncbi:hypothetical protein Airi01_045240 [Actinoallomurus iriomotensis]|uniref:Uncharacterized protein n=1 Tax=Actinoallomurus iriomotensis TaxID=478107 RepID=A0A9W6RLJ8_9ACTN|nr:hypothetical protein Airi01_045240 [Actinoallomurus iriomotensis]